jgi:lysine 6-dehydrogenase
MKAAVLGIGKMGGAICHAMKKLGFYVVGADSYEGAANNFRKYIKGEEGAFYLTDQNNADKSIETVLLNHERPDIVISSLPYHQTEEIALWCIDNGFRYCDLGGRVDVSKEINEYAQKDAIKPVFTDLGLAPGLVNILTEHGCRQIHRTPTDIKMMVGGLPKKKINHPINYATTWSIDGLINEYEDNCKILESGEVRTVKGMEGHEIIQTENLGILEAFYTSGGMSHTLDSMNSKGVINCCYKTLRYAGHRDIVKFLIKNCKLSRSCLERVFGEGCRDSQNVGDYVILKVIVGADEVTWDKELLVVSDTEFSAMQKATAFPLASVASLMAEGLLEGNKDEMRGYYTQYSKVLRYCDVPFGKFSKRLEDLGIKIK